MTNPINTRRTFTAQQRLEAVELSLSEGLSCTAVAQRLGLPNSSLAKWVRQARIDRGDFGPPEQVQLSSEERAELARLRREKREIRREKDFFRLAAAHYGLRPTRLRLVDARAAAAERFRLISRLSDRFSVAWLCKQLGVARRSFYGAPRVHQELRAAGLKVGCHRIARLMRCSALKAKTRRGFRPCRNPDNRASDVADNLLQQEFRPPHPTAAGPVTSLTSEQRLVGGTWRCRTDRCAGQTRSTCTAAAWSAGLWAPPWTTLVLEALNRAPGNRQIEPRPAPDPHRSGEPVPGNGLPAAAGTLNQVSALTLQEPGKKIMI